MLYIVFVVLLLVFVGKMVLLALKAAWGITKVALSVVVFPIILIGLVLYGLVYVALPILLIAGLLAFVIKPTV